jgi:hypothetical protein
MSDRLEANNGVLAVVRLVLQRKVVSAFALRISAVNFDTGTDIEISTLLPKLPLVGELEFVKREMRGSY